MEAEKRRQWWTPAKRTTRKCFLSALLLAEGALLCFSRAPQIFDGAWTIYDRSLRGSMFSGFLSVAGFLLALHTFVVVKMKEEVYDNDSYLPKLSEEYLKNPSYSRYGPLSNLSGLLFSSIVWSFLAALGQLTVGLIENPYLLCMLLAVVLTAFFVFLTALFHVRFNIIRWMEILTENEHVEYARRIAAIERMNCESQKNDQENAIVVEQWKNKT